MGYGCLSRELSDSEPASKFRDLNLKVTKLIVVPTLLRMVIFQECFCERKRNWFPCVEGKMAQVQNKREVTVDIGGILMKGIQVSAFGESDVLTLLDIADPVMREKDICIRLKAAGVNPVETYIRSGNYGALPNLPYTPGSDGAGIIECVGAKVEGFQIGERVFVSTIGDRGTGTYAQKIVCEADSVYHLPAELSFEEGAALGSSAFTAVQARYQKAKTLPGEYVLIHDASGGVGSLALQLAK